MEGGQVLERTLQMVIMLMVEILMEFYRYGKCMYQPTETKFWEQKHYISFTKE